MGASPNWLSDYVGAIPADATAVARPTPYAPTIGAAPARGTLPAPQPTTALDHVKAALNPVAWGQQAHNDINRAASLFGSADPLDKAHGMLLGAAAMAPLIPGEGELSDLRFVAPEVSAAEAAPEAVSTGLQFTAKEQKYADLLRRQGVKNPAEQTFRDLRPGQPIPAGFKEPTDVSAIVRDAMERAKAKEDLAKYGPNPVPMSQPGNTELSELRFTDPSKGLAASLAAFLRGKR